MASSSASPSSGPNRRRRPAVARWSWWEEVNNPMYGTGGGARPWNCKLCGYKRTGGANKVRAHFLGEPGHEVRFCPNVSKEKRQELLEKIVVVELTDVARVARRPSQVAVDPNLIARARASEVGATCTSSYVSSEPSSGTRSAPAPSQSVLEEMWNPRLKEETDMAVARFFFHDHIPFHAARSPYFRAMCTKIGECSPSYVPPSSETIRMTLLDREKMSVEIAARSVKDLSANNGVTLVVDGWSDTRGRSIHGVVAYSRGEMYFVNFHDASDTGKSADVLAAEWASTMETVGAEHVVAICADGELTNRATALLQK